MINFLEMMVVGGPVAVILVEEPTYRFLVVAFCGLVMFGGCVCLVFVPKIIAVYFYDPESAQYTIKGGSDGIQLGISSVNINSGMKNTLNIIEQSKEDRRKNTFDDLADRPVEGSNGIRNPIRS